MFESRDGCLKKKEAETLTLDLELGKKSHKARKKRDALTNFFSAFCFGFQASTMGTCALFFLLPPSSCSSMLKGRAVWIAAVVACTAIIGSTSEVESIYSSTGGAQQKPFLGSKAADPKPLFGRFLHFTDMHPDQYYSPGSSVNDACHKQSKVSAEPNSTATIESKKYRKKEKNRVGYWGAPVR